MIRAAQLAGALADTDAQLQGNPAVAGLVPAGKVDLDPELNAIQTLIARREDGRWRIVQFQNTPAQFHGRPKDAEALTQELRALV